LGRQETFGFPAPFSRHIFNLFPIPDIRSENPFHMSRVIAIANQKGGVGKTTTAINLGASLAVAERRTLIVDIDPQANASSGLGLERSAASPNIYDVLVRNQSLKAATHKEIHFPFLDLVPSTRDLVGAEIEMVGMMARETVLKRAMDEIKEDYDYVLVDCPPSLGLLTLNTLTAADSVLIPIQCEFYALEGLSQLLSTVRLVQRALNPSLAIEGVLLTMFDRRLNLSRQVAADAREYFGSKVFKTAIPRNVRLAEAPSFGEPIVQYDVLSTGAQSYLSLARELLDAEDGDLVEREGGV
jgi:chromosome partitioning protein